MQQVTVVLSSTCCDADIATQSLTQRRSGSEPVAASCVEMCSARFQRFSTLSTNVFSLAGLGLMTDTATLFRKLILYPISKADDHFEYNALVP